MRALGTTPTGGAGVAALQGEGEAGTLQAPRSSLRMFLTVFGENRLAVVGIALLVLIVGFCFLGPVLYHTNQIQTNFNDANLAPSAAHPLGTDDAGYDVLGRLMVAGRVTLEVGLGGALLSSLFGVIWGAISGYIGGWLDALMMRVVDAFYAIPPLLLMLLMATIFSRSTFVFIVVVAIVSWLPTARLVRGESLSLRVREYVEAARSMGVNHVRIVERHILRNVVGTIVVQTTLQVANAVLLLAALSYLGLGPPPPSTSWGAMLNDGLNYIYDGYWWLIYPAGVAIVVTVIAFSFVGDALRDAFDARLQRH